MKAGRTYGMFEVYGLELEYMVVDRDTLSIKSIVDELIRKKIGKVSSDVDNGLISWSNELSAHVVELKTSFPQSDLSELSELFSQNVSEINSLLESENAMLLPSAAHPLMDPFKESKLWEHDYNEVYEIYNQIFDCRGHGWSNLQSLHINLPFIHDIDFERLHAAIRLILPLIPALCASSPILDGKLTGFTDSRLKAYERNQEKIPSLTGKVIPEQVFSEIDYHKVIYGPIMRDIRPYDKKKVMDHHFLNSRGAIARFDRGAIEIRLIDVQECPAADMAITAILVALIKDLVDEKNVSLVDQKLWHEDELKLIFDDTVKLGMKSKLINDRYTQLFGITETVGSLNELWNSIFKTVKSKLTQDQQGCIELILTKGNLSDRIASRIGKEVDRKNITSTYKELAQCLSNNKQLQ